MSDRDFRHKLKLYFFQFVDESEAVKQTVVDGVLTESDVNGLIETKLVRLISIVVIHLIFIFSA